MLFLLEVLILAGYLRKPHIPWLFFLGDPWYQPAGWQPRLASLMMMTAATVSIGITGARSLMLFTGFILRLRAFDFHGTPLLCWRRAAPVVRFGVACSLAWSVGVGLVAVLIGIEPEWFNIIFLGFLGLVGTAAFVIPLLVVRSKVIDLREQAVEKVFELMNAYLSRPNLDARTFVKMMQLEQQVRLHDTFDPLAIWGSYTTLVVTSVVVPVAVVFLEKWLTM